MRIICHGNFPASAIVGAIVAVTVPARGRIRKNPLAGQTRSGAEIHRETNKTDSDPSKARLEAGTIKKYLPAARRLSSLRVSSIHRASLNLLVAFGIPDKGPCPLAVFQQSLKSSWIFIATVHIRCIALWAHIL